MTTDKLSLPLLVTLGSLAVHVEEMLDETNPNTRHFDEMAVRTLLQNTELQTWLEELRKQALLPVKRR